VDQVRQVARCTVQELDEESARKSIPFIRRGKEGMKNEFGHGRWEKRTRDQLEKEKIWKPLVEEQRQERQEAIHRRGQSKRKSELYLKEKGSRKGEKEKLVWE